MRVARKGALAYRGRPPGLSIPGSACALFLLLLTACADKPPIVSADTSCESFRYVGANDAQVKVFADNWEVMESYADQVISNNIEYTRKCLGVAP